MEISTPLASLSWRVCLAAFLITDLPAHGPHPEKTKEDAAPGLVIETDAGPNPWSHLQLKNDPRAFQFAVVTDRTGGHRPGVFEDAINKLNLLQPEFVMSVGDLIEGYSEDRKKIDQQWDEFQGFIEKLQMPFFYVAGNHDISNPVMAKAWAERFGRSYYSFVYHDVLFVCLNSQDPKMHHISEEQAKWLEKTLAAYPDVRWTLVFLHSPLWEESYPEDRGWPRVEKILGDRKYTVFSGHFHSYLKRSRNDRRYYTLATTGGGSLLRGPAHGEFDHVAWVTMTEAGPLVTNLMLQGIWADNIRTPEIRSLVRRAEAGAMVFVPPVVLPEGSAPEIVSQEVILTNPLDTPVELSLAVVPAEGVAVRLTGGAPKGSDGRHSLVLQPKSQKLLALEVKPGAVWHNEVLQVATLNGEAKFLTSEKLPVTLRSTTFAMIMPRLTLGRAGALTVDGDLSDWPAGEWVTVEKPGDFQRNADAWTGPADASFAWRTALDDRYLHVAVKVTDEDVQSVKEKLPWNQDGVELRIDPRPLSVRSVTPDSEAKGILIAMSPSSAAKDRWIFRPEVLPEGTRSVCVKTPGGYNLEAAIPIAALNKANPKWREEGLRFNIAIDDLDGDQTVQLWWHPDWRTSRNIPGSGTFFPALN
jgi:hypothetical protein